LKNVHSFNVTQGYDGHLEELLQGKDMVSIGAYVLGETIGKGRFYNIFFFNVSRPANLKEN